MTLHPCPSLVNTVARIDVHGLQAMLFAALSTSESLDVPYPTAQRMGDQPLSRKQFAKLTRDTVQPSSQAAASCRNDPQVTSSS